MGANEIRKPIQKRSIEKKEKIIEAGFKLICKKGYYNTNTAEIAKEANVSTGIIYQYFRDKHDILIEGIKRYAEDIFYPMLNIPKSKFNKENIEEILREMIKNFTKKHKLSKTAHEEITAMTHSDKSIADFFYEHEMYMTKTVANLLVENGFNAENILEKVHISINLIDDLCHEIVYHKHAELNYDKMIDNVVSSIVYLLNN